MQSTVTETSFSFVEYDGPTLSRDPAVRRLIRQRAMRDVAVARRQRGDYGQHNLRQLPIFVDTVHQNGSQQLPGDAGMNGVRARTIDDKTPSGDLTDPISKRRGEKLAAWLAERSVPRCLPSYAGMAMSPDAVLLLQMTPLTGLRLGTDAYSHLHLSPEFDKGGDIFSSSFLGSRRLLSLIPSRYGTVSSLSHSVDCVVAKLRHMTTYPDRRHPNGEALVLVHYNKALRALQADLNDKSQWTRAETLCAAELLGAFEMLNRSSEPRSWIRHVRGAARLIEARGPHRFDTEFEMALLLEHIGPSVMEAFLTNTPCFLADERWLQVLRTAICRDISFSDQQDVALGLWGNLVIAPQVLKETTDLILSSEHAEPEVFDKLVERIMRARENLRLWLLKAHRLSESGHGPPEGLGDGLAFAWPRFEAGKHSSAYANQLALQGTCLMCRIFKARLLYALAPARFHHLEVECQELAERVMALERHSPDEEGVAIWSLFMSQCTWIARGILETKDTWSDGCQHREGMIERWKFQAWCLSIGRFFPSVSRAS